MRSHGGISLNRALLAAGLVDRLEVIMFPAISGRAGEVALFHDGAEFGLELIESTVLDGRTRISCTPRTFTARSPRATSRSSRRPFKDDHLHVSVSQLNRQLARETHEEQLVGVVVSARRTRA